MINPDVIAQELRQLYGRLNERRAGEFAVADRRALVNRGADLVIAMADRAYVLDSSGRRRRPLLTRDRQQARSLARDLPMRLSGCTGQVSRSVPQAAGVTGALDPARPARAR